MGDYLSKFPNFPALVGSPAMAATTRLTCDPQVLSDSSGASKSHRHLAVFHQNRNLPDSLGKFQHFFQVSGIR
jgi:hypothetical protein